MTPAIAPLALGTQQIAQSLPAEKQLWRACLIITILAFLVLANQPSAFASSNWNQLSPKQQELLSPLQREWPALSPAQRDKWLRLGQRYEHQPPEKQAIMRDRVGNWNELSTQDQARARENFKALQNTQKGERNSQWNRYQSLETMQRERFRERTEPRAMENNGLRSQRNKP